MSQAASTISPGTRWKVLTFDHGLAFVAAAVLVVSICYSPEAPPSLSVCTFHAVTGLPCPGCGLTRAFCAISHGRIGDAWAFNPFGFLWYGLTVFVLARAYLTQRAGYRDAERRFIASRWSYILPIVLVTAMWSFGFYRIYSLARARKTPTSPPVQTLSPSDPPGSPAPAPDEGAAPSTGNPA